MSMFQMFRTAFQNGWYFLSRSQTSRRIRIVSSAQNIFSQYELKTREGKRGQTEERSVWLRVAGSGSPGEQARAGEQVRSCWHFVEEKKKKNSETCERCPSVAQHFTFANMPSSSPTMSRSLPETCCFLRPKFVLLEREEGGGRGSRGAGARRARESCEFAAPWYSSQHGARGDPAATWRRIGRQSKLQQTLSGSGGGMGGWDGGAGVSSNILSLLRSFALCDTISLVPHMEFPYMHETKHRSSYVFTVVPYAAYLSWEHSAHAVVMESNWVISGRFSPKTNLAARSTKVHKHNLYSSWLNFSTQRCFTGYKGKYRVNDDTAALSTDNGFSLLRISNNE